MTGERRHGRPPTELAFLLEDLARIERRLATLERPTGSQINGNVQKLTEAQADLAAQQATLTALVEGMNATLATWLATTAPSLIAAEVAAQVGAALAGNVSIGGSLYVGGEVTMPNVYGTNIVPLGGARTSVWVRDGGRLGHT